jgi:hypothetical protein
MTAQPGTTPTLSLSLGLITDNDEIAYREKVKDLSVWCEDNNLCLNMIKTKVMTTIKRGPSMPPFTSTGL